MTIIRFPKSPPFIYGCRSCHIAQFHPLPDPSYVGGTWTCRELGNRTITNFEECPLTTATMDEQWALMEKYNFTQGE